MDSLKLQQQAETQTLHNEIEQLRLLVDLEEGAVNEDMRDQNQRD